MKDQAQSINKRIKGMDVILGSSSSSSYVFAFTGTVWIHTRITAAVTETVACVLAVTEESLQQNHHDLYIS